MSREIRSVKDKRRNIWGGSALRQKISIIIIGALVVAVVIVLLVGFYQRMKSEGAYRNEYAGRVMDKWLTYHETELGTRLSRHLLIKSKNGEVFQVIVSPEPYEQAKIGAWVNKDKNGIQFFATEP